MLKFAYQVGSSSDTKARMLLTSARWNISHSNNNEDVKKQLLDFIDTMEKTRFPDETNNIQET